MKKTTISLALLALTLSASQAMAAGTGWPPNCNCDPTKGTQYYWSDKPGNWVCVESACRQGSGCHPTTLFTGLSSVTIVDDSNCPQPKP